MAPAAASAAPSASKATLTWRPTKIMNMRDLSKDDDFLSHLLVEKLGTGVVPLLVHKMDPSRRLPKTDAQDLLAIVRRLVAAKGPIQHVIRQAVDELLIFPSIRYYLKSYTQKQINAFATHASRYFELYNPLGFIEIAHTSRYSHRTGKSELCILATRNLAPGTVITELKGSMANLTDEEDKELKRTDLRNSDIRRDFSVIHSKQMKKNHLFLGPARFVNHDCNNNCELFREGKYITFRTLRPISIGEEITAHYGDGYFGRKNRHCLCETCEKRGRGGYAPESAEDDLQSSTDSDSDSDSDSDTSSSELDTEDDILPKPNVNERRTRRGVYAILAKKEDDSDESDDEDDNTVPLADAQDIPVDGEMELANEMDTTSDLTSLATSVAPSESTHPASSPTLVSPGPDSRLPSCSSSFSSLSSLSSASESRSTPKRNDQSPFRSIISTRRQKARESQAADGNAQLVTPPLSEDAVSLLESTTTPVKRPTRASSSLQLSGKRAQDKGKGREKDATPMSIISGGRQEIKIKKEETEPRALRTRPSTANIVEAAKDQSLPPEIPMGPDGKPLPTCVTCLNVLPVISVDSKVVWGLGIEGSPRKKKNKQECPRCMRHFAIYGQPWPARVPSNRPAFLPTPREETTPVESASSGRVTQKVLSVLDRKLAAAASASVKSRKREDEAVERPIKRRKTEPGPITAKVKKALMKGTGTKRHSLPAPPLEGVIKRKRGRPPLSPSRKAIKLEEKALKMDAVPIPQPRNSNGRFEKKIRSSQKTASADTSRIVSTRAERAIEREKAKGADEDNDEAEKKPTWTSPRRKRPNPGDPQLEELPRKRVQRRRDLDLEPPKKALPRPTSNFRGGKLFSAPNPLSFALQAWAGPMTFDESSEEEEQPPVTPEDVQSPPPAIVEADSTTDLSMPSPLIPVVRGALTFKPSPFNFAKRRWQSASASCHHVKPVHGGDSSVTHGSKHSDVALDSTKRSNSLSRYNKHVNPTNRPGLISSNDEVKVPANVPEKHVGSLTPMSDGHPSSLSSSDEEQSPWVLRHSYPGLPTDKALSPPATSFAAAAVEPGPTPNFVHAGWDSCSEVSDL